MKITHIQKPKFAVSAVSKPTKEGVENFVAQIKKESLGRQVVEVDGHKVIFGVEGPIILKEGKFWSISAHIENGRWGTHYILVSPNLQTLSTSKECFIRLDSGCISGVLGDITCDCMELIPFCIELNSNSPIKVKYFDCFFT